MNNNLSFRIDSKNNNIEVQFSNLAQVLLNEAVLVVGNKRFRIYEIEIYYKSAEHPDPYTHCSFEQKNANTFYFTYKGGSLKAGNRKGMDITIGDEKGSGGILIRGVIDLETMKPLNGPSKIVDMIMDETSISDLSSLQGCPIESDQQPIRVEKDSSVDKQEIYSAPRFGLSLHEHDKQSFIESYYRFFSHPLHPLKGKESLIMNRWLKKGTYTESDIKKIFGRKKIPISISFSR